LSIEERLRVTRVANCIRAIALLADPAVPVCPDSIMAAYTHSLEMGLHPKDLILRKNILLVTSRLQGSELG
jgi:hypothetical protein